MINLMECRLTSLWRVGDVEKLLNCQEKLCQDTYIQLGEWKLKKYWNINFIFNNIVLC